jgi:dTDP-4-amino-4,6-dideoxygalactose transaminase
VTSLPGERPAYAGGSPVRTEFLPFFRPCVGREEEEAIVSVLRSGWLSTGPRTLAFERAFAGSLGVRSAVGVSSCTAGLHLLLRAFDVGPGDEVITSPVTFPATVNAILTAGATPVFADVTPGRLTLDPGAVKAVLSPRTRALVAVHLAGWPCDMDALGALAAGSGLALIEDAAHALGARYRGRPAGALADAASFSFYATKNLTTGEGGMITTDRSEIVPRLRRERLHGIDLDATQRDGKAYRHWEAIGMGFKYNLTDFQAALGMVQLERFPELLAERQRLDRGYRRRLAEVGVFDPLTGPDGAETAAHLFPILVRPGALRIDRDELLAALLAENVGVGVHFRALTLHRHFRETVPTPEDAVREAVSASERLLSIPIFPGMSDRDLDDVVEALARIARYYAA